MAGRRRLGAALFVAGMTLAARPVQAGSLDAPAEPAQLCGAAVQAASDRYGLPSGLLYAIGLVESGRQTGAGERRPWPWTVQAEGQSHYFTSKAAAMAWVRQAQARGVASIDVGCLQINLMYHPTAFHSLADAFDPGQNALYAARFLTVLHGQSGDWREAAGRYHSETLALALPYRRQVEAMLGAGGAAGLSPGALRLAALQTAWQATLTPAGEATDAPDASGPGLSGDWSSLRSTPKLRKARRILKSRPVLLSDAR